jgi:hypothetical protein
VVLAVIGNLVGSGNTSGLIVCLVVGIGIYVAWRFLRSTAADSAVGHVLPNYDALGQEVSAMYMALSAPVKNELRKSRGATAYDAVFEMAFTDLICRFAALDGQINPSAAKVFLDVFTVLHPRAHAGLSAESGVALLEGHRQRNPTSFKLPVQKCLLFTLAQQAGALYANNLRELMLKVAQQVALADGPLSPNEQAELEALRSGPGAKEQQHGGNNVANADVATAAPKELDQAITIPGDERSQLQIADPQFTCATGLVTIDILKEKTKELVESLEPLLKAELRQIRQSSNARILLEQDIRATIIRFGLSNGSVSEYAAHLYLELFKVLHPKTFARWKVHDALDVLQSSFEKNRDMYLQSPTKPFTLGVLERMDATHGTGVTKPTRDIFLIIGFFAASVGGKVSEEKAAEIGRAKTIFETVG